MLEVINLSKETGMFPSCLKKPLVKAIFKTGSIQDVDNYHPASFLPQILENIIPKHFLSLCEKHKILNCFNSG
jgi:hypothetical protein